MALKHPSIKEFMKNSELSSATLATDDAINRISKNDNKVFYSLKDVKKVAEMGELMSYRHKGFWQCMDTKRDRDLLEELWQSGDAPWK